MELNSKVRGLLEKKLTDAELLLEGGDYYDAAAYLRAYDELEHLETFDERRKRGELSSRIDSYVREAYFATCEKVLSDHERKRERWCRYAAGSSHAYAGDRALFADTMVLLEEERFGAPK